MGKWRRRMKRYKKHRCKSKSTRATTCKRGENHFDFCGGISTSCLVPRWIRNISGETAGGQVPHSPVCKNPRGHSEPKGIESRTEEPDESYRLNTGGALPKCSHENRFLKRLSFMILLVCYGAFVHSRRHMVIGSADGQFFTVTRWHGLCPVPGS